MARGFSVSLMEYQGIKWSNGGEDNVMDQDSYSKPKRHHSPGSSASSRSSRHASAVIDWNQRDSYDRIDSRSAVSNGTADDEEQLARNQERAMRNFPDIFGRQYNDGSSEGSSQLFSFSHLEPERPRTVLHDVLTLSWYPSIQRVKRLAQEYMRENTQVRETSGSCEVAERNAFIS